MKNLYLAACCLLFTLSLSAQDVLFDTYTGNAGFVAFAPANGSLGIEDYIIDTAPFGTTMVDSFKLDTFRFVGGVSSADNLDVTLDVIFYDDNLQVTGTRAYVLPVGNFVWTLTTTVDLVLDEAGFVELFVDPTRPEHAGRTVAGQWFLPDSPIPGAVGTSPANFDGLPDDPNGNTYNYALQISGSLRSLPVTYADLGISTTEKAIRLDWTTAVEDQNAGFAVERAVSGSDFSTLAFREGHGTRDRATSYDYVDETALPNVEYVYRLKQMDYNGNYQYSELLYGSLRGADALSAATLTPNPAVESTFLDLSIKEAGPVRTDLMDAQGRRIRTTTRNLNAGGHRLETTVTDLPAGLYVLHVTAGGETIRRRLVKR